MSRNNPLQRQEVPIKPVGVVVALKSKLKIRSLSSAASSIGLSVDNMKVALLEWSRKTKHEGLILVRLAQNAPSLSYWQ